MITKTEIIPSLYIPSKEINKRTKTININSQHSETAKNSKKCRFFIFLRITNSIITPLYQDFPIFLYLS
ncbi:hypothetical protein PEG80_06055, partial [Lactococcus lactis]|uniref:hypothetical protein n=1 Tax=Lactococcus lactis TaxID=1358 RepID=UPI0022DEFEB4